MRLPEPRVRATALPYNRLSWQVVSYEPLFAPGTLDITQERRTMRQFRAPTLPNLSTLLWHTARCQETLPSPPGFDLQRRPAPSGGAIHPIHLLIERPEFETWARYDPRAHRLEHLHDATALCGAREGAAEYVDPSEGILVLFAAEPGMTSAKYEDAASIVWRDAGVLQGLMTHLAPQAGLGCCLLGMTADRYVEPLGQKGQLIGVGVAILGAPR